MSPVFATSQFHRFTASGEPENESEEQSEKEHRKSIRQLEEGGSGEPEPEPEQLAPPPQVQVVVVRTPRRRRLGFDDRSIRAGFIRKVFALVTAMFAVVAAFALVPMLSPEFRKWCHEFWWIQWIALAVFLVFYIVIACFQCARRCFPCNLVLLTIFTLSAGAMTMFMTAAYDVESVLIALLITTLCSASIIVFAALTKKDLTSCLGVAFILGMCLMLFGLMTVIFVVFLHWYFLHIVYSALGALLCMFYLAIDVQMIMGGRRVEISPEEYIYAAIHVFVDILTMFFHILGVVGRG